MNIYQEIKKMLTMHEIAEKYGLEVNRSGFCLCPFHAENNPSFKVYDDGFKCFGCGEGGDVIKFVEIKLRLTPLAACKKLNEDFGLNLNIDGDINVSSQHTLMRERRQNLMDKEKCAFSIVSDYLRLLNKYGNECKPKNFNEIPDKRFLTYLSDYSHTEWLYDELTNAVSLPFEKKEKFYMDMEDSITTVLDKLTAEQGNNLRKEMDMQFSGGEIIGNTPYKMITNKAFLKYNNNVSRKIADALKEHGIKFSGRVYSKLTTFTVNKKDMQAVRDIANQLCDRFARLERVKPQKEEMQNEIQANERI